MAAPQAYTDLPPGLVARDGNKHPVEFVSATEWRTKMETITNAAWVLLNTGSPMNHMMVQNLLTAGATVILAPANTGYSNDLTDATCGMPVPPGASPELIFTENLLVYARVEDGGADVNLYVTEAL